MNFIDHKATLANISRNLNYVVVLMLILFLFLACSGGEGGTGATDVSQGQITQFGSIFVNNVEFDTTNADISIDGVSGIEDDLKLNMVVTVNGIINADGITGTADSVSVEEVIHGFVQTNNGVDALTVLDQTIEISSATRFDGVDGINELVSISSFVEVSGYIKNSGVISAIRIELLEAGETETESLFGSIVNLDDVRAGTFNIGSVLIVDYANTDDIEGFPNDTLSNNFYVKVEGTYDEATKTLIATSVKNALISDRDVDEMEIEGFVTSVISVSDFVIGGTPIHVDESTAYEGGDVNDIVVDVVCGSGGGVG